MRITAEAAEESRQLLVHHRVMGNVVDELLLFLGGRQLPVEQEIGDLEEVAFGGKLLDRVSPVEQYALIAINVGDARATCVFSSRRRHMRCSRDWSSDVGSSD